MFHHSGYIVDILKSHHVSYNLSLGDQCSYKIVLIKKECVSISSKNLAVQKFRRKNVKFPQNSFFVTLLLFITLCNMMHNIYIYIYIYI